MYSSADAQVLDNVREKTELLHLVLDTRTGRKLCLCVSMMTTPAKKKKKSDFVDIKLLLFLYWIYFICLHTVK